MKTNFIIILTALLFSCNSKSETAKDLAEIKFYSDTVHFGRIKKGEIIKAAFQYQNIGKSNLKIINISPDCGCTRTDVASKTIQSGNNGKIIFSYDSKKDSGMILKTIVLETNSTPKLHTLFITGEVN
jgi:Protein of unknown function (DUF1573)